MSSQVKYQRFAWKNEKFENDSYKKLKHVLRFDTTSHNGVDYQIRISSMHEAKKMFASGATNAAYKPKSR